VSEPRKSGWTRKHTILLVVLVAAIGWAVYHWREPLWALLRDQERVREWVAGFGPWAPLVSVALNTAQVLLAPIPGQFIGVMNGYLYGIWLGTLYSMLGLLIGTMLAMGLARWFGRPLVERLVDPEQLARWDRITHRRGPPFFFLIYLFPSLPDDIVCFLIGLSSLALPRMIVLAMIGRLPGVVISCWVGAYAGELPWWAWIPLGGGAGALAWAFWRYQARLEAGLVGLIHKLAGGASRTSAASTSDEGRETEGDSPPN